MIDIGYIIGVIQGRETGSGGIIEIEGLSIYEDEDGFLVIEEAENGE